MNFTKKSFCASGLLLAAAALLSVPMIAQQEVSPDHFDEKPAVAKKHKPATSAKPLAAKKANTSNHAASKVKPAPAQTASLQTDGTPVQAAANAR